MIRLSSGLRTSMITEHGLRSMMNFGRILLFTGDQPASADAAQTGTRVAMITTDALTPVPGDIVGGLQLAQGYTAGTLEKYGNWVLKGSGTGTIGWWRFVWNSVDDGTASAYLPRIDGSFGDSFSLMDRNVLPSTQVQIDNFVLTLPSQ